MKSYCQCGPAANSYNPTTGECVRCGLTTPPPRISITAMDYHHGEIIALTIPHGEPSPDEIIIYDQLEQPIQGVSDINIDIRLTERTSELSFVQNGKTRTATIINIK